MLMLGAAVTGLALLTFLFWVLADLIAAHDVGRVIGPQRAEKLRLARDAARGRLVQIIAGLLGIGAFVFTARNFALARQQSELNRQTLELAMSQARQQAEASQRTLEQNESVQVTDRFARAIEQLGSEAIDVRLGAIYSLERIARDSGRDHPAIIEVLAAFVRRSSQKRAADVPQDLHAAMTVIARRLQTADQGQIKLRDAKLSLLELPGALLAGADLSGADLSGADLTGADLTGAMLSGTDLSRARLDGARLRGAKLANAVLPEARLIGADLDTADLSGADLTGATLRNAGLTETTLVKARLQNADLTEANLSRALLVETQLAGAVLDDGRLPNAVLRQATLSGVNAKRAVLAEADLTETVLSDAHLEEADLTGADLTNANFSGAELRGTRMGGVDLRKVKLTGLDLGGAIVAEDAWLPFGWKRDASSGHIRRETPGR
jgi:uncharacterized protein YjbI with pentapeptide repeats